MAVRAKSRSEWWKRLSWSVTRTTWIRSIGPLQIWERMEMQSVSSLTTQRAPAGHAGTNRSIWIGKASEERDASPSRVPALEASMRAYADSKVGTVVNPAFRTSFDSVEEAYEFYNLFFWETGFGVRVSYCNPIVARQGTGAVR